MKNPEMKSGAAMQSDNQIAVVTGANGFVGSHLVDALLARGYAVRCIVRGNSVLKWLHNKNVEICAIGLESIVELKKAFRGVHYIFHIAGVVKSKSEAGYFTGNVDATRNVLEAALEAGSQLNKVLVTSSQTASGPSIDEALKQEDDPCVPITTYGRSKLAQEELTRTYFDRLPCVICRPPAVYGERDTEIFIFFKTFSKGVTTTIGFDEKKISLIHISDLTRGLILAAETPAAASQTYFITSKDVYTWDEIIEVTAKVFGKKALQFKIPHAIVYSIAGIAQFLALFSKQAATLNIEKARDITQHAWICSPVKAAREIGFTQEIGLEQGIRRTVEWYRAQGWIA
jgi:nucleoside-diphosphate-sugar epimerase